MEMLLPNPTWTLLLWQRITHTQAHSAILRPQRNLSFPVQLYQCFSREKGFQRPLPGQGKSLGSCGSLLCLQLTWPSWRSRGFLLLVLGSAMWMVCSNFFWDFQGGENFWLLMPCHVLLGVILCKLLAYGPLSFSFSQKMTYLSLQTSPAHARFWTNMTWKLFTQFYCPHLLWSVQSDACFTVNCYFSVNKYFDIKRSPQNSSY